jgi:acyl-CoA reductase-like NAD-dependent aldehyde dehydrogenase
MASVEQQTPAETNGGPAVATISVENPATGQPITTIAVLGAEEIASIAQRGRAAQPGWEALGFEARGKVLRRAQKWMLDNACRIIELVVSESGKTHEDAQLADFGYTVAALGFWAKEAPKYLADERVPSWNNPTAAGKKLIIRYAPVGLVGVIGPWNYPIANSFGDCIPALAGREQRDPEAERGDAAQLAADRGDDVRVRPPGGCLSGGDRGWVDRGGADPARGLHDVHRLGEDRQEGAEGVGRGDGPCYLELGGKNPMIVCADADVERAANASAFYSMNNGGQVCISVERVYVEEPIYDEFVQGVTDTVRGLRQGAPARVGTVDIGAVTFPPQVEIIDEHIRDAVQRGAKVLVGGQPRPGAGRFYEPTVLIDVDHSMESMQEETFGSTIPIMKIRDTDEGVRLANDSEYGLQASVWTRDVKRGEAVARQIHAGVVRVNDAQINYSAVNLPMGGWKTSGLGARHGANGIRKYTKVQSLMVTRRALKREPFMFPLPGEPDDAAAEVLQAGVWARQAGLTWSALP